MKEFMITSQVRVLSALLTIEHHSQYPATPVRLRELGVSDFKYNFCDVLQKINEEMLQLAYQRWKMLSGDFENQIAPIRRVNEIMTMDDMYLKCDSRFLDHLTKVSKTLNIPAWELFEKIVQKICKDFCCTENVFYGMMALMLDGKLRIL